MPDQTDPEEAGIVLTQRGRGAKRRRRRKLHRPAPASIPGAISIHPDAPKPVIHVTHYDADHCAEKTIESIDEVHPFLDAGGVTWINVDGPRSLSR